MQRKEGNGDRAAGDRGQICIYGAYLHDGTSLWGHVLAFLGQGVLH